MAYEVYVIEIVLSHHTATVSNSLSKQSLIYSNRS